MGGQQPAAASCWAQAGSTSQQSREPCQLHAAARGCLPSEPSNGRHSLLAASQAARCAVAADTAAAKVRGDSSVGQPTCWDTRQSTVNVAHVLRGQQRLIGCEQELISWLVQFAPVRGRAARANTCGSCTDSGSQQQVMPLQPCSSSSSQQAAISACKWGWWCCCWFTVGVHDVGGPAARQHHAGPNTCSSSSSTFTAAATCAHVATAQLAAWLPQ